MMIHREPGSGAVRTFRSPTGREWSVEVFDLPPSVGPSALPAAHQVLRFTSAAIILDLADFPADWNQLGTDELVRLVRLAGTPSFKLAAAAEHRHSAP
jgi:hypothetical protein